MEQFGPIVVLALFAVAAAAVAYYGRQRKLDRQRRLAALALAEGLDYSIDDPFDTPSQPFSLLHEGDGRGVENVVWGFWHDLEVRAFDFWYYEESSDTNGRRSRSYSRYTCVITLVEASCPTLTIAEESVLTRLADALTFRDIEFESEEFNRRFNVRGADERFASAFCDARMLEWLLQHGSGFAFEVVGDRLLCWCRQVAPEGFLGVLQTAAAFREHIPSVVSSLYPR